MQRITWFLLPALILLGCVTTNVVTKPEQYQEINDLGRERVALITVQTVGGTVNYEGEYVVVAGDSVHWLDVCSQLVQSAPLTTLYRIRFGKSGSGALEGGAIGLVPGVVFTSVVMAGPSDHDGVKGGLTALGFLSTVGGAAIGGVIGALIQHKYEYIFHSYR